MRSLILCILILFSKQAFASWPIWSQLQDASNKLGWQVDQKILGYSTIVPLYTGQDPFPFCAAHAASILYDQHECMSSGKNCSLQPRTSALSLVAATQRSSGIIDWEKGGNPLPAIDQIISNKGAASHKNCNYNSFRELKKAKGPDFSRIFGIYSTYVAYRDWGGYLKRYHRDEFIWEIENMGLSNQFLEQILANNYNSPNDLFTDILLKKECKSIDLYSSKQYKRNSIENNNQDIAISFKTIQNLLKSKTPVGINFCLNISAGLEKCSKHSLVIVAESTAKNKITGDTRKVYRIANTWGEDWQKDHSDGWVFADQLLLGVYQIYWLESVKK